MANRFLAFRQPAPRTERKMPHRLKLKTPAEIIQTLPARPKPIDNKGKLPDLATPYLNFLTRFHVAEAVAEFIPFTYEQAILHNRRLADEYPETAQHFWIIGEAGQGDEWFIGKNSGSIFYFDHDLGELSPERLADLHIDFPQFLQLMFLCQDWYAVMESGQATPQGQEWFATLCRSIHADLPESYPFDYSELK